MTRLRDNRGQAAFLPIVFMAMLLGMCALVLDVGAWFRAHRAAQQAADAAALAAAQQLPEDPGFADSLARKYAAQNGGGLSSVTFSTGDAPNDTVRVTVDRDAPGFFAKLFGIDSVDVGARASARAGGRISEARWVAPITVNIKHPKLQCTPLPCFGEQTTIDLQHLHKPGGGDAAGAFGLLNLKRGDNGSVGASELGSWMSKGYDAYMPLGVYYSVPSVMFNSSHFREAMNFRVGDDVLFPIYKSIVKSGSNAEYDIVGWVGFRISGFSGGGESGKVHGHFTRVVWDAIHSKSGGGGDFGVRAVSLVE